MEQATISINGRPAALPPQGATVAQMLSRAADQPHIAVALNGAILPRSRHAHTPLKHGDSLEIVRPAGGG